MMTESILRRIKEHREDLRTQLRRKQRILKDLKDCNREIKRYQELIMDLQDELRVATESSVSIE